MTAATDSNTTTPLRVAFIGWGAMARTAAGLLVNDPVEIVAVATRNAAVDRPGLPSTARLVTEPQELLAAEPALVVEAAGRDTVVPWGRAVLGAGIDFVVASVSAFADPEALESLGRIAGGSGARLHIPPGALGGVDALAAARTMGIDRVEHRVVKPPRAWVDTPAETLCDLEQLTAPAAFFRGTAEEASTRFPRNANVAMTSALAGLGPAETRVTLVADPSATVNRHEISATGAFGELSVTVANMPLEANPKTSAMAALSLVRAVRNRVGPVVI